MDLCTYLHINLCGEAVLMNDDKQRNKRFTMPHINNKLEAQGLYFGNISIISKLADVFFMKSIQNNIYKTLYTIRN